MTGVLTDTIQTLRPVVARRATGLVFLTRLKESRSESRAPRRHRINSARNQPSSAPNVIRQMRYRLDIVAIRIENEGRIVVFVIMRPEAGSPIVFGARCQRRIEKGMHQAAVHAP